MLERVMIHSNLSLSNAPFPKVNDVPPRTAHPHLYKWSKDFVIKMSSQSRKFEFNVFNMMHLNGHNF